MPFLLNKTTRLASIISAIMFCLCITACSYSGEFKEATVPNKFAISFPDYMTPETEKKLGEKVSLQYCNYFRNIYTVVNEYPIKQVVNAHNNATKDSVKTPLELLGEQQYLSLVNRLTKPQKVSGPQAVTVNNLPALQYKVTGDVGGGEIVERIYYTLTIIEGDKQYYEIVFWTWDKWREKYLAVIDKITMSFKEL